VLQDQATGAAAVLLCVDIVEEWALLIQADAT